MNSPKATETKKADPKAALAVLEQMFGYFSPDATPLETPRFKPS
ncbi:hypothetical protein [Paracoccus sediminicola]|nr:hypothetical protein [Paracoccus sediminicola]WBU58261.1 hypothetical protein PAF18_07525 [Paracoccus sediminicola]